MQTKRWSWKVLAAATALALSAGGCKCSGNGASSASGEGGNQKVFQYFRTSVHKSLDPMKQFDEASADIVENVYDRLLQYDYLARPYQLVPSLLEKMPEKQADGVTYLFTLRKGVHFHDDEAFPGGKGREVKIDDVIYSIKRFADVNVNNLSYSLLKGFIVGLDDFRAATEKAGKAAQYDTMDVPGIKKVGDYEMTITFTRDNPLAFYPFAFSGMSIVPREAVEKYGDDFANHPVGTGAFYVKELSRRGNIVLAKNKNYFQKYPETGTEEDKAAGLLADAGKSLPLVDEVHLPLIEESQPAMLKFQKGEIDWIAIPRDYFDTMATRSESGEFKLKDEYAAKYNMYVEPYLSTGYIAINMNDKLLGKNKALRQAIAYAMDAKAWIDLLQNGRGLPLHTMVPHPIAGSERDVATKWYEKNIEMAKKKLAEAGFPNGQGLPPITVEFRATTKEARQNFEFIRAELEAIGVKLVGNFQTFSAFLQRIENGNHQMADSGWAADYPDAENFYALLYSKNASPGPNHSNYTNPKYDALYEKIRFMPNGPERFKLFEQMNEILKEDVPVLYRYTPLAMGLYQKRVSNMKRNMMINMPLKYINIDPNTKLTH